MKNGIITISIIGVGARGAEAYGRYIYSLKDKFKIVSLCDPNEYRLKKYGDAYEIPAEQRFTDEESFFEKKRSDILLIATMDQLHVRQAVKALDLDVFMEMLIDFVTKEEFKSFFKVASKYIKQ